MGWFSESLCIVGIILLLVVGVEEEDELSRSRASLIFNIGSKSIPPPPLGLDGDMDESSINCAVVASCFISIIPEFELVLNFRLNALDFRPPPIGDVLLTPIVAATTLAAKAAADATTAFLLAPFVLLPRRDDGMLVVTHFFSIASISRLALMTT